MKERQGRTTASCKTLTQVSRSVDICTAEVIQTRSILTWVSRK